VTTQLQFIIIIVVVVVVVIIIIIIIIVVFLELIQRFGINFSDTEVVG